MLHLQSRDEFHDIRIERTMPRPMRSFGLNDLALGQLTPSVYICSTCRHLALRQRIAKQQSLRYASSSNIPFTEKIRRRIWGTDNPPGLADPYGGESFLERRARERALQRQPRQDNAVEEEVEEVEEETRVIDQKDLMDHEYKPADTWEGLRHVGHKGDWRDMPPTLADEFYP